MRPGQKGGQAAAATQASGLSDMRGAGRAVAVAQGLLGSPAEVADGLCQPHGRTCVKPDDHASTRGLSYFP